MSDNTNIVTFRIPLEIADPSQRILLLMDAETMAAVEAIQVAISFAPTLDSVALRASQASSLATTCL